ncbi:hypothetical protein D8S78_21150 [Natrialba swarupiae]|nr:hypothetical protein [Natrialba swarupiae]
MNEDLTRAANRYADVMQAAAEGDLTVRMDPDATDTEPMREVATEFNGTLEQLEETIARLNYFAGKSQRRANRSPTRAGRSAKRRRTWPAPFSESPTAQSNRTTRYRT